MGTPHSREGFRLFRKRLPDGGDYYGSYWVNIHGHGRLNTRTDKEDEARAFALARLAELGVKKPAEPAPVAPAAAPATVPSPPPVAAQPAPRPDQPPADVLGVWASQAKPAEQPAQPAPVPPKPENVKAKVSAKWAAKVAGTVTLGVTAWAVRMMGRIPGEVDDEAMKALEYGWNEQIGEWLHDQELRPWMVIGIATVGAGVGMYIAGEDAPKKGDDRQLELVK